MGLEGMGEDTAGNRIGKELPDCIVVVFVFQFLQVGVLSPAKKLDPLSSEIVEKAAQGETRPVDVRDDNFPFKAGPSADTAKAEIVLFL